MIHRGVVQRAGLVSVVCASVALSLASVAGASATSPQEVSPRSMDDADVEVFMAVDATEQQVAAVERSIRASRDVRRFAHLTKDDAYREFRRMFRAEPNVLAKLDSPADLPESFRVQFRSDVSIETWSREHREMEAVTHVADRTRTSSEDEIVELIQLCGMPARPFVEVFMRVGATDAELDAAVATVRAEPDMTVVQVLDEQAAYEEFKRIFASKPKIVASVTAQDLPQSIRVEVAGSITPDVMQRLSAVPAVDSVQRSGEACEAIWDALAIGYTPEQLARIVARNMRTGRFPS